MSADADLLARIVDDSEDAINSVDLEGRITSWNRGAERLYGFTRFEAIGQMLSLHVPPEATEDTAEAFSRVMRGQTLRHFETVRCRKDGTRLPVSLTLSPIRDAGGAVIGASAIARDLTEQKRASEFAFKLLRAVEQAENVVLITDVTGKMIFVNPAFEKVYGHPCHAVLGQTPRILKSGRHDRPFYEGFWKAMLSGAGYRGEMTNRARDGRLITAEISANAIFDPGGRVLGFIAVQHDVTEKKLLESQFIQAQKMEAVGRLAGGIAHDFNNLLTAILGYGDLLCAKLPADSTEREHASEIRRAAERAADLTRQLLVFSRKQILVAEVVNPNDLVRESQKILERIIGEDVRVRTALDEAAGSVRVDRGQMGQVFMNLAVNARDAMPDGGTLTIETRNADVDGGYAPAATLKAKPGRYVCISFTDTGVGMDEATRLRMFEPFFTTKEAGKGTGLGLSTAFGIVKQSGGFFWVYSEPGRGATFNVYLPRAEPAGMPREALEQSPPIQKGTGTILLVEDEGAVRAFLRTTLEDAGYTVLEAPGGEAALALARSHPGPIRLLLTDMVMPGIGGPELAALFAGVHPETRTLFISGYAGGAILQKGMLESDAHFLQKPFSASALTRKVGEILGAQGRS